MSKQAMQYIKCPRCELNYIQKKDKFCDVCKSEMKAGILEENELDELEEGLELCPICKVNYITEGERMCTTCQEEQLDTSKDDEPDWRGFVEKSDESDDEDLDLLPVEDDDEIDEELEGAFAKDLESEFADEDEIDEDIDVEDLDDDFDTNIDDDEEFDEDDEDDYKDDDDDDDDLLD